MCYLKDGGVTFVLGKSMFSGEGEDILKYILAAFVVLIALCLFIIYPFYTILTKSVFSSKVEGMTLYNFERFFSKKFYYRTLIRSIVICSFTTRTQLVTV